MKDETPDEGSERLITVPAVVGLTLIILSVPTYFVLKRVSARWQTPVVRDVAQPPAAQPPAAQPPAAQPPAQPATPLVASTAVQQPNRRARPSVPPPAKSAAAAVSPVSSLPVTPDPPARVWPDLPPATFDRVKVLVDHGKVLKESEAVLTLHGDRLTVRDRSGNGEVVTLPYGSIVQAFFSRSKQPRWQRSGATEEVAHVDLGKMGFFRGDRNWLIFTTGSRPVFIALDDSNVRTALSLVEERTGVKIVK